MILKGGAARELSRPAAALAAFEAALRLEPVSVPALEGAAETAFRSDPTKARGFTDRLLAIQPKDPNANGIAGMLDYGDRKWEAAAAHFEKSGAAIAGQPSALEAQARALDHLGRQGDAETILKGVVERWPADGDARYDLAILQVREKRFSDVPATLAPLLAAREENALELAANAYEALGDTPSASAALRDAIQSHPREPRNYLEFAALSFDHSSFAAGIAMLDFGLKQLPHSAALYIARGALSMQVNRIPEAEQDFATANRLDPSQSFGFEAQGLTEIQRHDLPAALAKVRASLEAKPGDAYLHYLAAEILKESGAPPGSLNAREASAEAQRALALDGNLTSARNLLSEFEFQAGNYTEAAKQCRLVLAQSPADRVGLAEPFLCGNGADDRGRSARPRLRSGPGRDELLAQAAAGSDTAPAWDPHRRHCRYDLGVRRAGVRDDPRQPGQLGVS